MIRCKELFYSYDGKNFAVEKVSCAFEPGRFYGIFGPNGSGKSTLLKLLTGELYPTSGAVSPCWNHILDRAKNIALVEQQIPPSLPLTVAEVSALGSYPWCRSQEACAEKVKQVLEELELMPLAKRSFNALSGGERQRVMLARALVQETPILCLDEPGSSLDIGFQHTLCRILKNLAAQGKCVIMVSHDLFLAPEYLDAMLLMKQGQIIGCGSPEKLKEPGVLKEVFGLL